MLGILGVVVAAVVVGLVVGVTVTPPVGLVVGVVVAVGLLPLVRRRMSTAGQGRGHTD